MTNVQRLKKPEEPEEKPDPKETTDAAEALLQEILSGKRRARLADFSMLLAHLAQEVAVQAIRLPKQQSDMRLDAFKALTAYQAMLNRASEGEEGAGLISMRDQLISETPEPKEEADDGGPEDS